MCNSMWDEAMTKIIEKSVPIYKSNKEYGIVYGVVYAADYVDADGETMSKEDVQKCCWQFLEKRREKNIDIMHDWKESGCYVAENFFVEESKIYPPNSWVVGVKCTDDIFRKVKEGELAGFSFGGKVNKYPKKVTVEIAKAISGDTYENTNEGLIPSHSHTFIVHLDEKGNIIKGVTEKVFDHSHKITLGTKTQDNLSHSHRVNLDLEDYDG